MSTIFPREEAAPGTVYFPVGYHEFVDVRGEITENDVMAVLLKLPAVEQDQRIHC